MPHVVVKMYAGRSEAQKVKIAEALTKALMEADGCAERSVSVAIEDVQPAEWGRAVYDKEIGPKLDSLYKKPGYKP